MGRAPVDVWLLVPPLDPPPLTWLDDVERRRAAALAPGPAARFIAGRQLLRAVLGGRFGLPPGEVRLVARCIRCGGPHGQVGVVRTEQGAGGAPPCHVSISRSGPLVAVATAEVPVGVDVESVEAVGAAPLADVALSADERERHVRLPHDERPVDLARTWAGKEAVLKALGAGLDVDPSSFTLTYPSTTVGAALERRRDATTVAVAEPWNGPGGGVVGAVAVAGVSSLALRVHDGAAALSRAGAGLL
jgi:4'-phosphopantetheinyl transferase